MLLYNSSLRIFIKINYLSKNFENQTLNIPKNIPFFEKSNSSKTTIRKIVVALFNLRNIIFSKNFYLKKYFSNYNSYSPIILISV